MTHPAPSSAALVVKRAIDLVGGAVLLLLFAPLLLASAVAVKLDSKGPVFFRQERLGLHGRVFRIFKFRSMYVDAGAIPVPPGARRDPRVTRVGYLLRKYKIDELPQLFNVVLGDMSLVGPRPLLPETLPWYEEKDKRRMRMRPGVTGLQQVTGGYADDWETRIASDLRYIDAWSLYLDVVILLKTPLVILAGKAQHDPTGGERSGVPTRLAQERQEREEVAR